MQSRLDVKVYYEDTDSLGVVYYANYLKYFERGRSEHLGSLGKPIAEWNAAGYVFAVFKIDVTYHKPARLGDLCQVVTETVRLTPVRLRMAQRLLRGDELLTEADVHLVCVTPEFELQDFPDELLSSM